MGALVTGAGRGGWRRLRAPSGLDRIAELERARPGLARTRRRLVADGLAVQQSADLVERCAAARCSLGIRTLSRSGRAGRVRGRRRASSLRRARGRTCVAGPHRRRPAPGPVSAATAAGADHRRMRRRRRRAARPARRSARTVKARRESGAGCRPACRRSALPADRRRGARPGPRRGRRCLGAASDPVPTSQARRAPPGGPQQGCEARECLSVAGSHASIPKRHSIGKTADDRFISDVKRRRPFAPICYVDRVGRAARLTLC